MTPLQLENQETFEQLLERFETEWQHEEPPDLATYCQNVGDSHQHRRYLQNLIELDLEYRWRRFRSETPPVGQVDGHGFPQFPRLDDYVSLVPPAAHQNFLTPEMAAEEYRVRTLWGDVPGRQDFLRRFASDSAGIEGALNRVESDISIDHDQSGIDDSGSLFQASTINVHPTPPDAFLGSTVLTPAEQDLGKYHLIRRLGRGAFGEVWQAWDPSLKRDVAIKRPRRDRHFSREELKQFYSEAEKLAQLGRVPGIVSVFDFGEQNGQPYIVTDFIEGQSLKDVLQSKEITEEEAIQIAMEVAEALTEAHSREIYHRDVKPGNILLDDHGRAYLADFGLAVTQQEQQAERHAIVGTLAYMSPEQARGARHETDRRTDIYALGAVLYRLLTGRVMFAADDEEAFIEQILHATPIAPREVSADISVDLERICLKCLQKDPSSRYSTAEELTEELRRLREPPATWRMLIPVAVVAAGLIFAAVSVLGGFKWEPPEWTDPQVVVWEPFDDRLDKYGFNRETESFDFDTMGYSLWGMGACETDRLHLQVRCHVAPGRSETAGAIGLFWALDSVSGDDRIDGCCWAVSVRPNETGVGLDLRVQQLNLGSVGGKHQVLDTRPIKSIELADPGVPVIELAITVNRDAIEDVLVNGQPVLSEFVQLKMPLARDWNRLQDTQFGVYGFNGSFSVEDFQAF